MDDKQLIGLIAGILTGVSLLPQLIKTIREKEAKSISLGMLMVLICGNSMWIYYGVLREDIPIIATNIFSDFVNVALLFFSIRYKKNDAENNSI